MVGQKIITFEDILRESENLAIKRDLKCLVFFMKEELELNRYERREFL